MSGREGHVSLRWLADLRDGRLQGSRLETAREHLDACVDCAARLARLDATLSAAAEGPLPSAPRPAVRRAQRLYRAEQWRRLLEGAGRLVGRLVYDQRLAPVAALRSAPGETRRLLWTFGDYEVDAAVSATPQGSDLLGQLAAEGESELEGEIVLYRDGRTVGRSVLGHDGRFTFRGLSSGSYTLAGRVEGRDFALPPFVVGG